MTRIFAITAASDQISTGRDGRGEISFTVTNSSPRPLRGQLRVRPLGATKGEWLNLAGEVERDFSPRATQQVVVGVQIPPGTPAGNYQFRLDTISLVNPDDDFTEGPTIALEVRPSEAPKKPFPWWIIAAAAAGLLLIVSLTWWLWPSGLEVPDVVGLNVVEARKKLEDLKFKVELTPTAAAAEPSGKVLGQEPEGKSKQKSGATITLSVAEKKADAGPKVVFEDDFEQGNKHVWSQSRISAAPNGRTRFLGQFWSDSVQLTLEQLPPHKTVTVSFDLYVINTWDGEINGDGPDVWGLRMEGGPSLLLTTFANTNAVKQRYACRAAEETTAECAGRGAPGGFGAAAYNTLGFLNFPALAYKDSVYKMKSTFAHNRSFLVLTGFGDLKEFLPENRNFNNESWGLDNVRVEVQ